MLARSFLLLLLNLLALPVYANENLSVEVLGEEIAVNRYPAEGDQLILFISTGYGLPERISKVSAGVAERGNELWHVDLVENLFLPRTTSTFREMDGSFVAGLITQAHAITGKKITVMTRAYASIPVLRGVRKWQQKLAKQKEQQHNLTDVYLNGVILISPELYIEIPDLGLEPVFAPIASASNVPVVVLQSGRRGNRWQMENMIDELQKGGAKVYSKIFPGVTGVFYREDNAPETLALLNALPLEIERANRLLVKAETTLEVKPLEQRQHTPDARLDIPLRPFKGNPLPPSLDLLSADGDTTRISNYRGKITLVNFWATWCGPCVEEIPSLNRLREQMKGKPFELVSVDYAEDQKSILAFMDEVDVDFPVLLDTDGKVSAKWGVVVFPSTFVIGPDGKIVYGVKGGIHWDSAEVKQLLDALLTEKKY